jgi:sensory rhodopsin
MTEHVTITYSLTVIAFAVGCWLAVRLATSEEVDADRGKFWFLLIIPGFAGLMYVLMALNIGTVTIGSNTIITPRYIDWLITTPILVGYVGYVAGAPRRMIAGVMAADAAMILTGGVATVLAPPGKWIFFGISSVFHLTLFGMLYGVFPRYAKHYSKRRGLFKLLQNHVGLLWLAYPLVWLVGAPGLGYVSAAGVSLIIAYLDVVAKVPYVYFIWNRRDSFDLDANEMDVAHETPTVSQSATADD